MLLITVLGSIKGLRHGRQRRVGVGGLSEIQNEVHHQELNVGGKIVSAELSYSFYGENLQPLGTSTHISKYIQH